MIDKKPPRKPDNLRVYDYRIVVNRKELTKLEISPYYEKHNREYLSALERKSIKLSTQELTEKLITDDLIIKILLPQINGEEFDEDSERNYQILTTMLFRFIMKTKLIN